MANSGYRDYFKTLGVDRTSSPDSIKSAFRKLARKYHPDVNPGDTSAEAKFKEINEAYEVLSDSDKRRKYEQFGRYWNQSAGFGGNGPVGSGFDVDFGRYGNFDDFINDLLGRFGGPQSAGGFGTGFPRGRATSSIDLDAEVEVKVSFAEAFNGTERILSVNEERVQVRIPKGIKAGSRLRLKGKGNLQPGTGSRGDLYLKMNIQSHPVWQLDGDQLRADLPVSLDELALGCTVSIFTLDGEAEVVIPEGTTPGRCLRLKGKGWPVSHGRGDLLLTLRMQFPSKWSTAEKKLLSELRMARSNDPRNAWIQSARL